MFAITPIVLLIFALTTGTAATISTGQDSPPSKMETHEAGQDPATDSVTDICDQPAEGLTPADRAPGEKEPACFPETG